MRPTRYLIEAVPGDNLVVVTATPSDGPYEPANDLDPLSGTL